MASTFNNPASDNDEDHAVPYPMGECSQDDISRKTIFCCRQQKSTGKNEKLCENRNASVEGYPDDSSSDETFGDSLGLTYKNERKLLTELYEFQWELIMPPLLEDGKSSEEKIENDENKKADVLVEKTVFASAEVPVTKGDGEVPLALISGVKEQIVSFPQVNTKENMGKVVCPILSCLDNKRKLSAQEKNSVNWNAQAVSDHMEEEDYSKDKENFRQNF